MTQIIYCNEWSLSLFQNSWMHEFFIKSIEYTSLLYNRIAKTFLNETFKHIKETMNQLFDEMNFLNIVNDESNNQSDNRILNMCMLMKNKQFFHAFSESVDSMRLSAANTTVWMLNKMNILTHEDFRKINSIIIDMCNLKPSVWNNLAVDARLKHVFFVSCDFHDLQLLLKDLLHSSLIQFIFIKTLKIVNFIWKVKHQLDILCKYQKKIYDQHKSLIVFIILRWEIQVHLIESLVQSKVALRRYATDDEVNFTVCTSKFLNLSLQYIQDVNFWIELDDLLLVLQFIHEQQKMSENNQVTVDKIYIHWIDIQTHLNQCIQSNRFDQAIKEFLWIQFTSWLTKQIMILHRVTHYLHSTHYNKSLNVFKQGEILCFLRSHTESQYHTQIESKFFEFREREEIFNSQADAWNNDDDSVLFWRKQISKNFYYYSHSTDQIRL